jgi:hypothetical protein
VAAFKSIHRTKPVNPAKAAEFTRLIDGARTRDLLLIYNLPTLVSGCCPMLQNRLIYAYFVCWWLPTVSGCCALSGVSSGVSSVSRRPYPRR